MTDKNMDEKLLKIIEFYGVLSQLKYFQSEIFELNEAIISYENFIRQYNTFLETDVYYANQEFKQHIAEEIADVMVMLMQFKECYHIDGNEIMEIMTQKIDRQLDRMNSSKED